MRLSNNDEVILRSALRESGGFHLATKWFWGWEPLPYQYVFHHIPILNTTFLAGIGSGKTANVAASYTLDCLSLPGFKALNASVTAKQAELAYEMVDGWIENNPRLKRLIVDRTLRPYPILKFYNRSEFEFRTAGLGAKFIRGHEYDRINYDEGGLDEDGEAIRVLRGRLRGIRPSGEPRMARLDVTSTPTSAEWLRKRFEQGLPGHPRSTAESLKHYFSMRVSTYDNTRLTKEQIELMEAEFPAEYAQVEIYAQFPDWGLSTFAHNHIQACVDVSLYDDMYERLYEKAHPTPGYVMEEWPRVGVVHYEIPEEPGQVYVMAGDPGTDSPPRRNSPCVMVFNVTKTPAELVYFDWINGRGSYHPFMASYKYALEKYAPVSKGIDVTGTQKSLGELGFEDFGLVLDDLHFGGLKETLINSLSLALSGQKIRFPRIEGIINQLNNYKREKDKDLDQDLVMTLAMIAYLMRFAPKQEAPRPKKTPRHDRRQRTAGVGRRR